MTFQIVGPETRLKCVLRQLAVSQAQLARHTSELETMQRLGHCVREALAIHDELREKVAQGRRDLIWAHDRIRFGLDEAGIAVASEATSAAGSEPARAVESRATVMNRKEDADASTKSRPGRQAA